MGTNHLVKVYFVFPNRVMGGCSILFLRLARHLTLEGVADCILVDYADGYMALNAGGISLREYGNEDINIESGAIFVTQSNPPWTRFERITFATDALLFYWNVHPFNFVPALPYIGKSRVDFWNRYVLKVTVLRSYYKRAAEFVLFLNKSGGLAFMDHENLITTEMHLGVSITDPMFLPIPVERKENTWSGREPSSTRVNVLWVGRIVDFKYHILRFAINQIGAERESDLNLTIVGDGDHLAALREFCLHRRYSNIHFRPAVPHESLENLMLQFDLVLAMGTTAIEAGMLGIPVIIMDPSYESVDESYSFRWLHDLVSFDLGSFSYHDECKRRKARPVLLVELIDQFRAHGGALSNRVHTYSYSRHSLDRVATQFTHALLKNKTFVMEAQAIGFGKRGRLYSLYLFLRATAGKIKDRYLPKGDKSDSFRTKDSNHLPES